MTLKQCKKCNSEINQEVDKCPNCGAPQKSKHYGCGTLIVVSLLVWIIISLYSFIFSYIFPKENTPKHPSSTSSSQQQATKPSTTALSSTSAPVDKKTNYINRLKKEIDGIDKYKVEKYTDSKDSIIIGIALFSAYAILVEDGNNLPLNKEEQKLLKSFKDKVSATQVKAFPKLRAAYGTVIDKILWENDISVSVFGSGARTIDFIGARFAANRNIKEFQVNAVGDTLRNLRFERAQYKWYKDVKEYQYYDLKSFEDNELIIWVDNEHYRNVK